MNLEQKGLLASAIIAITGIALLTAYRDDGRNTEKESTTYATASENMAGAVRATALKPPPSVPITLASATSAGHDYRRLEHRLDAMRIRRQQWRFEESAIAAAVARDSAWTAVDRPAADLPLKPKELADGRQFIQFDPLKMETLMPGDEIVIALDTGGTAYRARIDTVEVHDGERVSWGGHLLGQNEYYSVTFTRGKHLTVGGLNTPRGHYQLQSHGEHGWIAASSTLKQHAPHANPLVPPTGP